MARRDVNGIYLIGVVFCTERESEVGFSGELVPE